MALPTGSGTETLQFHFFYDCDGSQTLIFGVQHHVYTVVSIIVCCRALNATTDLFYINFHGHDAHAGASQQTGRIVGKISKLVKLLLGTIGFLLMEWNQQEQMF